MGTAQAVGAQFRDLKGAEYGARLRQSRRVRTV
jgi:hypothetical protein